MFVPSKIGWMFANPAVLLLGVLVAGALLLCRERTRRAGRVCVTLGVACFAFVAVVPVGPYLLAVLEDRFPAPAALPRRIDGIVVLGGFLNVATSLDRGRVELNTYADRMTTFMTLARTHPDARLVVSGGSASLVAGGVKEADLIVGLLAELGMPPERILLERSSRNTCENAAATRNLVRPTDDQVWVLITSGFHMPRAMACFRALGWDVLPYPTDYQTGGVGEVDLMLDPVGGLAALNLATHEFLGLAVYRLMGMTDELWPAPGS